MTIVALIFGCRPLPPTPAAAPSIDGDEVHVLAIGDTGKGNDGQRQVAAAMVTWCTTHPCDLLLMLGDNLYPDGMTSPRDPAADEKIAEMYAPLGVPIYLALGNHDYGRTHIRTAADWQIGWAGRTEGVHLPGRYYAFTAGPAAFYVLDTDAAWWEDWRTQAEWLHGEVPGKRPWTIVAGHHTFRSEGAHGNAGRYEGVPGLGNALENLFEQEVCGRADLYLSGHDHTLQHLQECDLDLVVSGAGASTHELADHGNQRLFAASQLGFAWIRLGEDGTLVFVGADGSVLYETSLAPRAPRGLEGGAPPEPM